MTVQEFSKLNAAKQRNCRLNSRQKRHYRVIMRDGLECKICKKKTDLSVHHILDKYTYPHFANDYANLITLCRECHDFADANFVDKDRLFNLIGL